MKNKNKRTAGLTGDQTGNMKQNEPVNGLTGNRKPIHTKILLSAVVAALVMSMCGCGTGSGKDDTANQQENVSVNQDDSQSDTSKQDGAAESDASNSDDGAQDSDQASDSTAASAQLSGDPEQTPGGDTASNETQEQNIVPSPPKIKAIAWDDSLKYAEFSKIHTDAPKLYEASGLRRDVVVAVNAGHGTKGGESKKTQCHPDGSAKVTGGSTQKGATSAVSVSSGATMKDGTSEADAVLSLALLVKDRLLEDGFDVLMIRESSDVQLDNIARTVLANNYADCHISLHYDSTDSNKGFFYISVPDVSSYRSMEPVKSHWKEHHALGDAILTSMKDQGVKISGSGHMAIDLTQTSYSTVPSVDLEVGDRATPHGPEDQEVLCEAIVQGLENYWS